MIRNDIDNGRLLLPLPVSYSLRVISSVDCYSPASRRWWRMPLMLIRIEVIQSPAITASIGVALLIFTKMVLLPILLS